MQRNATQCNAMQCNAWMYVCMYVSLSVACTGCNIGMIYILFVESSHVRSLVIIQWSIGVNPWVSGVCLVRGWDYCNTRLKFSKIQKNVPRYSCEIF